MKIKRNNAGWTVVLSAEKHPVAWALVHGGGKSGCRHRVRALCGALQCFRQERKFKCTQERRDEDVFLDGLRQYGAEYFKFPARDAASILRELAVPDEPQKEPIQPKDTRISASSTESSVALLDALNALERLKNIGNPNEKCTNSTL